MTTIQTRDGTFPISRFGEGQALLRPSSDRLDGERILHFCCFQPLPIGGRGTLLNSGEDRLTVRVVERFGDYYNVEVVDDQDHIQ